VDISGGEDIRYTEVHSSMDESCSGTLGAIKEDPASMLIFVLDCYKTTRQRVEMDQRDGERV